MSCISLSKVLRLCVRERACFPKICRQFFRVSVCVGLTCVYVHVRVHQRCARTCVTRAGTGGIYSSAATVGRPRVRVALGSSVGSRALAAGVSWTSRTTSAPWAARYGHTTVVDAAGAIYVIGGTDGSNYQDVWASTDGGADGLAPGVGGYRVVPRGTRGYYEGTTRVLRGYYVGTGGIYWRGIKVYEGGFRGTRGVV
jgi:hypothetical protein